MLRNKEIRDRKERSHFEECWRNKNESEYKKPCEYFTGPSGVSTLFTLRGI